MDGVIANFHMTEAMLKYFINKALGGARFLRPEVMVAVPGGISSVERRAVIDATIRAGARAAYVIKEPIVAAIGADIPIGSPSGHMIIDIGGGTMEAAVISLGGIVASKSVRIGGNKFDVAIQDFIRRKYGLAIGERTSEDVKITVGSALKLKEPLAMDVRGRDIDRPPAPSLSLPTMSSAIKEQARWDDRQAGSTETAGTVGRCHGEG